MCVAVLRHAKKVDTPSQWGQTLKNSSFYENRQYSVWHNRLVRGSGHGARRNHGQSLLAHSAIRHHPGSDGRIHAGLSSRSLVRERTHSAVPERLAPYRLKRRQNVRFKAGHELSGGGRGRATPVLNRDWCDAFYC
jgi:hypothetical protein